MLINRRVINNTMIINIIEIKDIFNMSYFDYC